MTSTTAARLADDGYTLRKVADDLPLYEVHYEGSLLTTVDQETAAAIMRGELDPAELVASG